MKSLIAITLGVLLLGGCAEKSSEGPSTPATATSSSASTPEATTRTAEQTGTAPPVATASSSQSATNESHQEGTWTGQIAVAQPISTFNYVGAESGDFAPIRFRNESAEGKKILGTCSDGDLCEFTGAVEWLDEAPPADASAVGQIVRVDSVKRGTSETR